MPKQDEIKPCTVEYLWHVAGLLDEQDYWPGRETCAWAADLIDKLPKTKDGVSVVPTVDRVWFWHHGEIICQVIAGNGTVLGGTVRECYSSRKAAEAKEGKCMIERIQSPGTSPSLLNDWQCLADHTRRLVEDRAVLARAAQRHLDEIKRLQGIVDKLPKCWRLNEQGNLVQDVAIELGMTLFARHQPQCITEFEVYVMMPSMVGDCDRYRFRADECYNTREAAEAEGK
jgi:hypothetical protein